MSEEEAWNEGYVQGLNDANRSIKLGKNMRTENPYIYGFCPQCKCNLEYQTAVHMASRTFRNGGKNMNELTLQNLTESINTLAESLTSFTDTMNNFSKNILLDSIFWDGTEEDSVRVLQWINKYNVRAYAFYDSEDEYTILIEDYSLYARGSGYFLHDNKSFTFVPEEDFR